MGSTFYLWRCSALALVPGEPSYRREDDGCAAFEPHRLLELWCLGADVTEQDPVGDRPDQLRVLDEFGKAEAHDRSSARLQALLEPGIDIHAQRRMRITAEVLEVP